MTPEPENTEDLQKLLGLMFQAHPWHGLSIGPAAPGVVTVYIELVPADTVKYEIDKRSGMLKLDRPQRYSSLSPEPYGFIPRTLCGDNVAAFAAQSSGRKGLKGDRDPLDVCVLTERAINHGGVVVRARPIGGLRMFDGNEVDDKIIAVLESDPTYEGWTELEHCPPVLIDRIQHYFLTYKDMPGSSGPRVEMVGVYGAETAREVIARSQVDYRAKFGDLERTLDKALSQFDSPDE
ncbi:MAG: inorganic pyrophosphatase [Candidatus Eisenbacteria bacterium]|nr:inorganic pyrophosphatase [Candidatus Eisenbacteria bacterium]